MFQFLILSFLIRETLSVKNEDNTRSWYQTYADYPPYCSTPDQMKQRFIPKLYIPDGTNVGATKLAHVTVVLNHGARTTLGPETNGRCWDGYWENEETGVWNCDLETYLAPPSKKRVDEEEDEDDMQVPDSMFLFDLVFDALKTPQSNNLNGTCQESQLILRGYDQQIHNGKMLRRAYLSDPTATTEDDTDPLTLFSLHPHHDGDQDGKSSPPWDKHFLYVRSGDSQPTMMSGQILMRGMFEDELEGSREREQYGLDAFASIAVHTADDTMDILGGFQKNCPKLDTLKQESYSTKEFQEFYNSAESQQVRAFMTDQLSHEQGLFDCMMTTICTDRPLPEQLGDYEVDNSTWFNRISTYHTRNHTFPFRYNDGEYSKLSIGPLWAEILDHVQSSVVGRNVTRLGRHPPAKLAIYSGYDSTIMQLLASLGEGVWNGLVWPPYASMFLIEIHHLLDDDRDKTLFRTESAFRLIYNGKVLTDQVPGCSEGLELCDAEYLLRRVEPIAVRKVDCDDYDTADTANVGMVEKSILSTTWGILLVILALGMGAFAGATIVVYKLTGTLPGKLQKKNKRLRSRMEGRASVSEPIDMRFAADASPAFADPHDVDDLPDPILT